jgi:glycosyltransferase involved in cell wall biosynthesis
MVQKLELHLYHKAAGVACVTRAFIENLDSRGISREKCAFLPNGVVMEDWTNLDGRFIRGRYGIDSGAVLVSYVGTVGMAHQIGVLVEAAEMARREGAPLHFMVAGDGAELGALRQRAEAIGLTNMTFTGLVPREAARDIVGASDVVVVHLKESPLFRTVLPSKMFEAMAAGKPIILGVKGEALDVLKQAGAGVGIAPGDARALLDTALQLAHNDEQRNNMGQAGREFVGREFSRSAWAGRYLEWMKGVLSMGAVLRKEARC